MFEKSQENCILQNNFMIQSYPSEWRGRLSWKCNGALVQLHSVSGDPGYFINSWLVSEEIFVTNIEIKYEINLNNDNNWLKKLSEYINHGQPYSLLLAVPFGKSVDIVMKEIQDLRNVFSDYMLKNNVIGISLINSQDALKDMMFIFTPSQFKEQNSIYKFISITSESVNKYLDSSILFVLLAKAKY